MNLSQYEVSIQEMTKTQVKLHENSRKWCKTPKTQAEKSILSYANEKGHLGDPPNEPFVHLQEAKGLPSHNKVLELSVPLFGWNPIGAICRRWSKAIRPPRVRIRRPGRREFTSNVGHLDEDQRYCFFLDNCFFLLNKKAKGTKSKDNCLDDLWLLLPPFPCQ